MTLSQPSMLIEYEALFQKIQAHYSVSPASQVDTDSSLASATQHSSQLIPLHAPCFNDAEKRLLNRCIDSTFVSSVGEFVGLFEEKIAQFTGARHAIAVVNGTLGLFLALKVVGVQAGDLVLTQSLTFVATPNAIKMLGADPVFLDVSKKTMGLSVSKLTEFLETQTYQKDGQCFHSETHRRISACVPMHTLGIPVEIKALVEVCHQYHLKVVEDAAESLGSTYQDIHTGIFGDIGVFSFNGNKIITTGGGGMLVTQNAEYAQQAKHLSTTAKVPHTWLFEHDQIGYNLRMPNLNAALGVAQMQKLPSFLAEKRYLAELYKQWLAECYREHEAEHFSGHPCLVDFSPDFGLFHAQPNAWLTALLADSLETRDAFLHAANEHNIQVRPLWTPMHQLDIYRNELRMTLTNTEFFAERVVNVPSGVRCHTIAMVDDEGDMSHG